MRPTRYYTMYAAKDHRSELHRRVVRSAMEHGIRQAALLEGCSRNTVRKWLRRYQAEGIAGLREKSRAPNRCPHKTASGVEAEVLAQRAKTPGFGAARLKREFELTPSVGAISRILRQKGLTRPRKRKHRTKRDLRAVKAAYAPLTYNHMDVKYLNDIPHFWPFLKGLDLPEFQYTIRDVKTGAAFVSYGSELSATYAELTVRRFLQHLKDSGIDTNGVVIQTDQGGEFQGQLMAPSDRGFTHTIENTFGARHRFIRTGNPNANADVESFHSHEEREFFDIESFRSRRDFFAKVETYQHYWNLARPNSYKANQTPLDILKASDKTLPTELLLLPPLDLDKFHLAPGVGHDVPVLPASLAMLYPDYIDNPRVFSCPSTKDQTRISVVEHEGARWVCFGAGKKDKPVANPVQYSGKELSTNQKCSYLYDEHTYFRDVGPGQAMAADADGFNFQLPDGSSPPYPANWSRKPRKPNHDNGHNVMYFDGSVRWASQTPYASDDPLDNIFCPNGSAAEKTPWGADTDAYLWDGVNAQGIQWE